MGIKRGFQNLMISLLEKRWPGLKEVVKIIETIEKNVADTYGKGEESPQIESSIQRQSIMMLERQESVINHNRELFKEEDGVWRPILLTLGLLYKVQKIYDDTWYVNKENFCSDSEKIESLMNGLAKYWLYHFKVSQCIKTDIDDLDELKESMAEKLQKPVEDILYVYHRDSEKEDKRLFNEHIGDISIVVDHEAQEVILSVCETKLDVAEIVKDLFSETIPFLDGQAHMAMANAANNILVLVMDPLVEKLKQLPGYKLVILGYSLGGGVAQLLTLALSLGPSAKKLPANTKVNGLTFGSPPVYVHNKPDFVLPNLISVYNHNDGIATATLDTFNKLFLEVRAVKRMGISKKKMVGLLRRDIGTKDNFEISPKISVRRHQLTDNVTDNDWRNIIKAKSAITETGFTSLHHIAGVTYLLKRKHHGAKEGQEEFVVRQFVGTTDSPLHQEFRLRGGMFSDHMIWAYSSLFQNKGGNVSGFSLDTFDYTSM